MSHRSHHPFRKTTKTRNRVLRNESLEPRALLSGDGLSSAEPGLPAMVGDVLPGNKAPTLAKAIVVNGNAAVTGKTATLSVLGSDDGGEAKLVYTWSVTTAPEGGIATFALNGGNNAKNSVATFSKAGTYKINAKITDAGGLSVNATATVVVMPMLKSIGNVPSAAINVSGTSLQLPAPALLDQFGNAIAGYSWTWSNSSSPAGAPAPTFTNNGAAATANFKQAGFYILTARLNQNPNVTVAIMVSVNQTLSSIAVSPNTASIFQGALQQFSAQGLDQFGKAMTSLQSFTWSASSGSINASGLFTAPLATTACTVTAKCGSVTGQTTVTVKANTAGFQNASLSALVSNLKADGSISRADMIQILRSVGADNLVDAAELSDLKKLLTMAGTLNIPEYVQILAGDVINGNAANATYQGSSLGNLAAGSSAEQLNKLIDKWFLGTDHPTLCNTSLVYKTVAGSLFPQTPSHADERQGQLGDCYFISALGTLADSNPAAVKNMFINNGDGTYTVRFYTGTYGSIYNYSDGSISAGFANNLGTVDYVTVDSMLPTSTTGILAYADYGASYVNTANSLWIPLAEKAYAQWNQTGKAGRDGTNAYASIQGGWMATVDAQVLGYNATDFILTTTSKQVAVNALAAHKAVTIGTQQWTGTKDGLYASHAYAIIGYNAATDQFTLYNPWGSNQPGALSWSQLQADCTQLCIAGTSGTIPFSTTAVKSSTVAAILKQTPAVIDVLPPTTPAAAAVLACETGTEVSPAGSSAANFRDRSTGATTASRDLLDVLPRNDLEDAHPAHSAAAESLTLSANLIDAAFANFDLLATSRI